MQLFMTLLAVIAGMAFSLAIAIFVEELVFGKVFGFMTRHMVHQNMVQQPVQVKPSAVR